MKPLVIQLRPKVTQQKFSDFLVELQVVSRQIAGKHGNKLKTYIGKYL